MAAAIDRGFHQWDALLRTRLARRVALIAAVTGGVATLVVPGGRAGSTHWILSAPAIAPTALIAAAGYLLPAVEVAPPGHTRFDAFRRAALTVVLGLLGAYLAKRLIDNASTAPPTYVRRGRSDETANGGVRSVWGTLSRLRRAAVLMDESSKAIAPLQDG
jgi:hypothetical protein